MNKKMNKNNKGFSLVELIIVIAIMVILAGVLIPQFAKYMNNSRVSADIDQAQNIYNAVTAQYAADAANGGTPVIVTGGYTDITSDADAQALGLGAKPTSKVSSGSEFAYYVNGDEIKVAVFDGTDYIDLVPVVKAGSDWDR